MGTGALIGAVEPDGAYTARWVQHATRPGHFIPVLRVMWEQTFGRDTAAMIATLLRHEWSELHGGTQPCAYDFVQPVAGVGDAYHEDLTGLWRGHAGASAHLQPNLAWMYLINPHDDLIDAYQPAERWQHYSRHTLTPDPVPTS